MTTLARCIGRALSATLLLFTGCGGRTIGLGDTSDSAAPSRGGSETNAVGGRANSSGGGGVPNATTGGRDDSTTGGSWSGCTTRELPRAPQALEFLVDSSLSMKAELAPGVTRWNALREAIQTGLRALDDRTLAGLVFYPNVQLSAGTHPGDMWCFLRYEAATLAPLASTQRDLMAQALAQKEPLGATPTHDAYLYALGHLEGTTEGTRHLVLLTDGAPTYGLGCTGTGDAAVDTSALTADVAAAQARSVDTFVVGLGGAENGPWMSRLALAGGTARPGCSVDTPPYCHYQVSAAAEPAAALREALLDIGTRTVSCVYEVPFQTGNSLGSDRVNLAYRDATGSVNKLDRYSSFTGCDTGYVVSANQADQYRVELCPALCRAVVNDAGVHVLELACW